MNTITLQSCFSDVLPRYSSMVTDQNLNRSLMNLLQDDHIFPLTRKSALLVLSAERVHVFFLRGQ